MAHGRTRHNRSFKPIVYDIIKGESVIDVNEEGEEELNFKKVIFLDKNQKKLIEKKPKTVKEKTVDSRYKDIKSCHEKKKLLERYYRWLEYCQNG